jgi:hypothetical protein
MQEAAAIPLRGTASTYCMILSTIIMGYKQTVLRHLKRPNKLRMWLNLSCRMEMGCREEQGCLLTLAHCQHTQSLHQEEMSVLMLGHRKHAETSLCMA